MTTDIQRLREVCILRQTERETDTYTQTRWETDIHNQRGRQAHRHIQRGRQSYMIRHITRPTQRLTYCWAACLY